MISVIVMSYLTCKNLNILCIARRGTHESMNQVYIEGNFFMYNIYTED